jgi:hypothetical protein
MEIHGDLGAFLQWYGFWYCPRVVPSVLSFIKKAVCFSCLYQAAFKQAIIPMAIVFIKFIKVVLITPNVDLI